MKDQILSGIQRGSSPFCYVEIHFEWKNLQKGTMLMGSVLGHRQIFVTRKHDMVDLIGKVGRLVHKDQLTEVVVKEGVIYI